jgi:hypothetical protein
VKFAFPVGPVTGNVVGELEASHVAHPVGGVVLLPVSPLKFSV